MDQQWGAVFTAILSALVILIGYVYEKRKERQFELDKTRQNIYTRLIINISEQIELFELMREDEDMPKKITKENLNEVMAIIKERYPKLNEKFNIGREIMSLMAIYADDAAVLACAEFYKKSLSSMQPGSHDHPDISKLMEGLRKTIYRNSKITNEDIQIIISK